MLVAVTSLIVLGLVFVVYMVNEKIQARLTLSMKKNVPRWVPRLTLWKGARNGVNFRYFLELKNKHFNAILNIVLEE